MQDLIDLFRNPVKVKESFSQGFIWISLVIVLGQILIVTFAGQMFSVEPISFMDWVFIILVTSPVLIIPDLIRGIKNLIKGR